MTLPSEEVYSLKRTREFLRRIITGPRQPQKALKDEAHSCLRHYPWDMHIEKRWAKDVCEHGTDRVFCQKCKSADRPTTGQDDRHSSES